MVLICLQLLFLLPLVLCDNSTVKCEPGEEGDCSKCYTVLVEQVTKQDRNLFNVQNTFYPPDGQPPVFVTVLYIYEDYDGKSKERIVGDEEDTNNTEVWFWSKSVFYLFQPLHVFQFTSLLFSDTALQWATLNLTLPTKCANASDSHKKLLTQRVSIKFGPWTCIMFLTKGMVY
jgi:hypothetical protein